MPKLVTYIREVMQELRKVTWPSREQTLNQTLLVLAVSGLIALYLGGLDFVFQKIMTFLVTN